MIVHDNVYTLKDTGLGCKISFFSAMICNQIPFTIYHPVQDNVIQQFKDTFEISDDVMTVVNDMSQLSGRSINYEQISDYCKLFSPYYQPDHLVYRGQRDGIPGRGARGSKKAIAIANYRSLSEVQELGKWRTYPRTFPHNRYYPIEYYSKIYELAIKSGYDVITLDNLVSRFDERMSYMNEMVECFIGYEGGNMHQAHLLGIPCIILPWLRPFHTASTAPGRDHWMRYSREVPQLLHLDKKTYFADSIKEVINWTPTQLRDMIEQLYSGQGNNSYLSSNTGPVFIDKNLEFLKFSNGFTMATMWTQAEQHLFNTYRDSYSFRGQSIITVDAL